MKKVDNIITILPRSPWPPYAGQSRLAFYRSRELKKKGYHTTIIWINLSRKNISSSEFLELRKAYTKIKEIKVTLLDLIFIFFNAIKNRIFSNIPLQASLIDSPYIKKEILLFLKNSKIKNNYNFIIHCYSLRTYAIWKLLDTNKIDFVLDLVDSLKLNIKEKVLFLKGLQKLFWLIELKSINKFESNLPNYKFLKAYLVVSQKDAAELNVNISNIKNFKPIFINNVGIETRLNKYSQNTQEESIIFFGSLSYEPNVTAIKYLINKIMPLVWQEIPDLKLVIAGREPSQKLIDSCKNKNILIFKNPKNMDLFIRKSKIAVAPMISGSGQQFKILEAIMNMTPVITTTKGAKPLGLLHNVHVKIEDNPNDFAISIIHLLKNINDRNKLSDSAYNFVNNMYSWGYLVKTLEKEIYLPIFKKSKSKNN